MPRVRTTLVNLGWLTVVLLCVGLVVNQSPAQTTASEEASKRSLHLLDRGTTDKRARNEGPMTMSETLAAGSATPGLTSISVVGSATMLTPPAFYGNFFSAPADFPSSWYPFAVTGVFAWSNFPSSPPADQVLGAGVAPGPFPGDMGTMWAPSVPLRSPFRPS